MQTKLVRSLKARAQQVAAQFSRKDRGGNTLGETFNVDNYVVLSECTAAVIYRKDPTDKRAVAFFYYINSRLQPRWEYFFVTYNHLAGMNRLADLLHNVEQHNFAISSFEEPATDVA